ncbi:MAG: bifunctional riboflavin kinase/FAD synthetase [Pseudomonadota bacterium]
MSLIRAPLACPLAEDLRGSVAVMGNFDGVHRGHKALIAQGKKLADRLEAPFAAITFEPHPRRVFRADAPPFILTPLEVKAELLEEAGARSVFALPFVDDLFKQSPEEFVTSVLQQTLGLRGVATGQDFQFGAGRAGSSETLAKIATSLGIAYEAIVPVGDTDEKFSSSSAREALRKGDPKTAAHVLGYNWFLDGMVTEGRKLARQLGFPTANVVLGDVLRPLYGVYAVHAEVEGTQLPGIANIGVRPTVDGQEERLEVHLFDWDGDLYGKTIRCRFVDFIREERPMEGLDALKAQIAEDCGKARAILAAYER